MSCPVRKSLRIVTVVVAVLVLILVFAISCHHPAPVAPPNPVVVTPTSINPVPVGPASLGDSGLASDSSIN